ncbi:hypothetical protein Cob_v006310 [Colletotrichum orbiculare MAFF 240422]|uniref:Uncharacterized protein n=1 Tax=Colletotrichum orbiculare (strain 104-T / ATCC 96160 / CBS 514.97 / LARS 414 / MAFF 240422) TaxID=1213857 RepID=N4V864_COLOR|nr:hypothetical protein Cob_v006310 [Colletotrichum orbiculare MAFF 240422]
MSFHFVHAGDASSSRRKAARSHVMKGKNAGKVIASRGKKAATKHQLAELIPAPDGTIASIRRLAGSDLSTFSPGAELTPHIRLLLSQYFNIVGEALYPSELCEPSNVLKMAWFEYMINDKAFFHVSLAVTAATLDFYEHADADSPQCVYHTTQAIRHVNKRLTGCEKLSDTTIGVVCMLTIQESVRSDLEKYQTHMRGLYSMVDLRGGIRAFDANDELQQKIYRTDIQYALQVNCGPRYFSRCVPESVGQRLASVRDTTPRNLSITFDGAPDEVLQLVKDVEQASFLFNNIGRDSKLSPEEYKSVMTSLCYRLKHAEAAHQEDLNANQKVCLVGLVCLMTTLLLQFGRQRRVKYTALAVSLKQSLCDMGVGTQLPLSSYFWLLMIGGISVFDIEDEGWLLPGITRCNQIMGLKDWTQARSLLQSLPWIHVFHTVPGKELWQKTTREVTALY